MHSEALTCGATSLETGLQRAMTIACEVVTVPFGNERRSSASAQPRFRMSWQSACRDGLDLVLSS